MFKEYNEARFLRIVLIATVAIYNALRGFALLSTKYSQKSAVVVKLQELMPLSVYGIILCASTIILIIALCSRGFHRSVLMIVGGLLGTIGLGLYASASSLESVYMFLPFRYTLMSFANLSITIAGGFTLWQTRKMTM